MVIGNISSSPLRIEVPAAVDNVSMPYSAAVALPAAGVARHLGQVEVAQIHQPRSAWVELLRHPVTRDASSQACSAWPVAATVVVAPS
mmetsp:Transcript_9096/g.17384  ORF Transcript_9096/g.17384 Transcript_9096/m.17384 type:complete len:88 (+) Transcript_9096:20-283(+)